MTGVSIEHLVWGGGYVFPDGILATYIKGYSGRQYAGDIHNEGYYYDRYPRLSNIPYLVTYLYHGAYGNQYGIFYLTVFGSGDATAYRTYIEDASLSKNTDSISVQLSESMRLSELIVHDNYAHYFDVLPQSWLSYIRSKINPTNKFQLRFIPQSDLEEWLNTYWKYEPNK